ncbi:MAG TPA: hypothetical protein VF079_05060 [Sphingomicrobium sp.]
MLLFTALLIGASAAATPTRDMPVVNPIPENALCPETPMSVARKMGKRPPHAIPLSKLPPAQTFMAVDRRIDGCPAPLTAGEYRRAAGRR